MSVLLISDTHIAAGNPKGRKGDYASDIKDKLAEIAKLANEHSVSEVICAGDVFHMPTPAYSAMSNFVKFVKELPCPFVTIPGSHDLKGGNLDVLHQTAVGLLYQLGIITLLSSSTQVSYEGIDCIIGTKFAETCDIELTHEFVTPKPDLFGDYTLTGEYQTEATLVAVGHYHNGYVTETVNNTIYVCPGSIARTQAQQSEFSRRPKVVLITGPIRNDDSLSAAYSIRDIELESVKLGSDVLIAPEVTPQIEFTHILKQWASVRTDEISAEVLLREIAEQEQIDSSYVDYAINALPAK